MNDTAWYPEFFLTVTEPGELKNSDTAHIVAQTMQTDQNETSAMVTVSVLNMVQNLPNKIDTFLKRHAHKWPAIASQAPLH